MKIIKSYKNESIVKTIIIFSDTVGGKLVVGVRDNRNIISIDSNILDLERQRNNISYNEELNYDIDFESLDLSSLYNESEKQNKGSNGDYKTAYCES